MWIRRLPVAGARAGALPGGDTGASDRTGRRGLGDRERVVGLGQRGARVAVLCVWRYGDTRQVSFLMILRAPRSALFPYTTLFRSRKTRLDVRNGVARGGLRRG